MRAVPLVFIGLTACTGDRPAGETGTEGTTEATEATGEFDPHYVTCEELAGGPTGTLVASTLGHPGDIAVDATHVYWVLDGAGTLSRAPKAGGAATTLVAETSGPPRLALDETYVYFTDGHEVHRVLKVGGDSEALVETDRPTASVVVNDTHLYFTHTDYDAPGVGRAPKDGGEATYYLNVGPRPFYLALDDTRVYWTNHTGGADTVQAAGLLDESSFALAVDQDNPTAITTGGGAVYWTNLAFGNNPSGGVMRGTQDEVERFAASHAANNIAMDETHVYWTDAHSNASCGSVRRRPIAGGNIEVVAVEPESHIWGLAVGPDAVYWTAWDADRVMRIDK